MKRYHYERTPKGTLTIHDRERGLKHIVATTEDVDDAQRIVDALNTAEDARPARRAMK